MGDDSTNYLGTCELNQAQSEDTYNIAQVIKTALCLGKPCW